jgi:hypothetical protein
VCQLAVVRPEFHLILLTPAAAAAACYESCSHALGDRRLVIPVRKSMTPYSKLIVRNNPPLPLQVSALQIDVSAAAAVFSNTCMQVVQGL